MTTRLTGDEARFMWGADVATDLGKGYPPQMPADDRRETYEGKLYTLEWSNPKRPHEVTRPDDWFTLPADPPEVDMSWAGYKSEADLAKEHVIRIATRLASLGCDARRLLLLMEDRELSGAITKIVVQMVTSVEDTLDRPDRPR